MEEAELTTAAAVMQAYDKRTNAAIVTLMGSLSFQKAQELVQMFRRGSRGS